MPGEWNFAGGFISTWLETSEEKYSTSNFYTPYEEARDEEVINALAYVAKMEGILFALESSHAAAEMLKVAPKMPKDKAVIVNMSGRGDKDIFITAPIFNKQEWVEFLSNEIKN